MTCEDEFRIRQGMPDDLEALYAISLATGHIGEDASHLYDDGRMMGHIYSAPYLVLDEGRCIVAERSGEVVGFAVGTPETRAFEKAQEAHWWPRLRGEIADPDLSRTDFWSVDERRAHMIHHPKPIPADVVERYPGHLHLNLLKSAQGRGLGRRMAERMIASLGTKGVHVGVNRANGRATRFWRTLGFVDVPVDRESSGRTLWLGRAMSENAAVPQ